MHLNTVHPIIIEKNRENDDFLAFNELFAFAVKPLNGH